MRRPTHRLQFRRLITGILLPVYVSSCTSWRLEPLSPEHVVDRNVPPSKVRLTLVDSTRVVLEEPSMAADSVVGESQGARRAVALVDIAAVQVRSSSTLRTALLVAGIAIATLAAIHFTGCRGEDCPLGAPRPPPGP